MRVENHLRIGSNSLLIAQRSTIFCFPKQKIEFKAFYEHEVLHQHRLLTQRRALSSISVYDQQRKSMKSRRSDSWLHLNVALWLLNLLKRKYFALDERHWELDSINLKSIEGLSLYIALEPQKTQTQFLWQKAGREQRKFALIDFQRSDYENWYFL